jgi:hypothetical protein
MAEKKVTPAKPDSSKDTNGASTTAASRVTKRRNLRKKTMKRVHGR